MTVRRGALRRATLRNNINMSQAINVSEVQDALSMQNRITELESVLRTVLEQINNHQIYDMDARVLIRRALSGVVRISQENNYSEAAAAPRRATEFPSFFPSASGSANFL